MKTILLKSKSTSPTKLVNFLIFVTFNIKDLIGHYLKLVVLRDYTQIDLMNKDYLNKNYIIEVQKHIANWNSQIFYTCDLQTPGMHKSLHHTSGTSRLR